MAKNNCLENLRTYKLEHQAWFNDIHKRLNLFLVDKKKVKFESLEKVASKWIIPVASDLKNLEGVTDIQKLILVQVQEYKKILELLKKSFKGTLFESKAKLLQKRDNKIVMHAEAMATAHSRIVKSFNNLEKDIIIGKLTCNTTITTENQATVKNNTVTAKENRKIHTKKALKNSNTETTNKKQTTTKIATNKVSTPLNSKTKNSKGKIKKETLKKEVTTTAVKNIKTTTTKETKPISNTTLSMETMLNQDLLNSLNKNRKKKTNEADSNQESFNLQEEIKKIIG